MEATLQGDLFNIGIKCYISDQAETVGSLREIEIEYRSVEQNAVTLKQPARRARLASRMPSNLRRSSKDLIASFTNILTESIDMNNGGDSKKPHQGHTSVAGCISTTQAAQFVANECLGEGVESELSTTPLIMDEREGYYCDINSQYKDSGTNTTCSESRDSMPSLEDALALEVGLSAQEYLEECFYTEVSVLDREKFNAIPEIFRSDFTITVSEL